MIVRRGREGARRPPTQPRLIAPAAVDTGITGTLAVTLGAVTVAASGEIKTEGTLSRTLGDVTAAASGELKIQGALSQTLADATLAGAGLVKHIHGGLSTTLANTTLAAAGEVEVEGALAQTLAAVTLSGSGIVGDVIVGTLDATLSNVTLSAVGDVEIPPVVEDAPSYHGGGGRRRRLRDGLEPLEVEAQYELLELRRRAADERRAREEAEVAEQRQAPVPAAPIEARGLTDLLPPTPADPTALVDERVRAFTDEQARISEKSRAQVAGVLAEAKRLADEEFMLMAVAVAVALEDED